MNTLPTCFILSAELANLEPARNARRTSELRHELDLLNLPYKQVYGRYGGTTETSFLVVGYEHRADVMNLARKFQQESVLELDPARRATLVFMADDVSEVYIGQWGAVEDGTEASDYTYDPETQTRYEVR